jgi:hypothetical protein
MRASSRPFRIGETNPWQTKTFGIKPSERQTRPLTMVILTK